MLSETKLAEVRVASLERTARDDIELDNNVLWVPMSAGWLVMSTTTFTPFFGQDEARALTSIGALTDMSLSRVSLMERDRAHVEAMRDFVAIASHDLRTPSAAIAGYASLLEHKWEAMSEADKRHAVGAVNRQSKHLSRLVEDLLMTSRIDGFAIPMEPVTIDVSQCLEQVVRDVGVPGVAVTVTPALSVVMDADHFRRIITNYLRNAEVYGAAPIRVEAAAEAGEVQIRVIDHGAGVPIEFQPRLFEKFARADQKMSNATGGTGLGLSIVSGLAKAAGGSAWFAPHEPQGSVFGLTLPLPVSIPQQTPKESQWTSDESSSSSRTRLTSAG
jgi:signal transduction histidine kinase